MDYERLRLERAGKDHLARNIEQVSKTMGDRAGYDIRSYHTDGRDRFIEVKTTRYGRYTPFYISEGEVRFSKAHADCYHLYRVFGYQEESAAVHLARRSRTARPSAGLPPTGHSSGCDLLPDCLLGPAKG